MQTILRFASAVPFLAGTAFPGGHYDSHDCCQTLEDAGIQSVLLPNDLTYLERVQSYWSVTSQLKPTCFVQPMNTQEVSTVISTLVQQTDCKFAVRSGGHSSNAGFNNIEDGVTIDLGMSKSSAYCILPLTVYPGLLNGISYDPTSKVASLGPGSRWIDVYKTLDAMNVSIQGGGIGSVGVGGLLLGGGFSPYLYRRGLATDDILNLEIVLANGDILEASSDQNSDIYRVLKGGGSGFGVVTRFDMRTFDRVPLWESYREYPASESVDDSHIAALKRWTDNKDAYETGSAFIWWTYRPAENGTIVISAVSDNTGQAEPAFLDDFLDIPGYSVSNVGLTNMSTSALATQAANYSNIWFTLTFKNDERVIRKAVEMHRTLVEDMKQISTDGNFETQCYFQPLPSVIGTRGAAKGGNILGIDELEDNAIVLLGSLAVNGAEQEDLGRKKVLEWKDALEEYSTSVGAFVAYRYSNYADASQDVLGSYGQENVETMLLVSEKYDPSGVFQTRMPGGFKLPLRPEALQ